MESAGRVVAEPTEHAMSDAAVRTADLILAYEIVLRHQQVALTEAELVRARTRELMQTLQAELEAVRNAACVGDGDG